MIQNTRCNAVARYKGGICSRLSRILCDARGTSESERVLPPPRLCSRVAVASVRRSSLALRMAPFPSRRGPSSGPSPASSSSSPSLLPTILSPSQSSASLHAYPPALSPSHSAPSSPTRDHRDTRQQALQRADPRALFGAMQRPGVGVTGGVGNITAESTEACTRLLEVSPTRPLVPLLRRGASVIAVQAPSSGAHRSPWTLGAELQCRVRVTCLAGACPTKLLPGQGDPLNPRLTSFACLVPFWPAGEPPAVRGLSMAESKQGENAR